MRNQWKKLTLRQRITWSTSGVVFVFSLILTVFINSIAPIFITREVGSPDALVLIQTVDTEGNPITLLVETPGSEGYTIAHDPGITRADPYVSVRLLSGIGLIAISGLGFLAAKWIAQKS